MITNMGNISLDKNNNTNNNSTVNNQNTPDSDDVTMGMMGITVIMMALAICGCSIISLILGIISIVIIKKAKKSFEQGDHNLCAAYLGISKILCIIGFIALPSLMIILYFTVGSK